MGKSRHLRRRRRRRRRGEPGVTIARCRKRPCRQPPRAILRAMALAGRCGWKTQCPSRALAASSSRWLTPHPKVIAPKATPAKDIGFKTARAVPNIVSVWQGHAPEMCPKCCVPWGRGRCMGKASIMAHSLDAPRDGLVHRSFSVSLEIGFDSCAIERHTTPTQVKCVNCHSDVPFILMFIMMLIAIDSPL